MEDARVGVADSSREMISLTAAAKLAPGRPSVSCIWRWCRRGVLARTGERVRLQHQRVGGKIYTTAAWLEQFGSALASADERYFSQKLETAAACPPRDVAYGPPQRRRRVPVPPAAAAPTDQIDRELQEEGL